MIKYDNWYFDENKLSFGLCFEECQTCSGPSINECLSCKMGKYLYLGYCLNQCPSGYSPKIIDNNNQINFYYQCYLECYENCETCSGIGYFKEMKCIACKENYIKYKNNCYNIVDSKIKNFYDPENNNEESSYNRKNLICI